MAHRTVACLAAATTCLAAVCVTLAGLLIWRELVEDSSTEAAPVTNLTVIKETFPGYFRTPEEQTDFERLNNVLTPVKIPVFNTSKVYKRCFTDQHCELYPTTNTTTTASPPNQSQQPNTTGPASRRKRRQISTSGACDLDSQPQKELTFHGCCISYSEYIKPDYLTTAQTGQRGDVEIAQFGFLNQYFEIQHCCQAQGCSGCQCAQTYYVVSAVVNRPLPNGNDHYVVEFVLVPGCCQCLNIDSDFGTPKK